MSLSGAMGGTPIPAKAGLEIDKRSDHVIHAPLQQKGICTRWAFLRTPTSPSLNDYRYSMATTSPSSRDSVCSVSPARKFPEDNLRPWTQNEYDKLLKLREQQHCSWERVSDCLPGRSVEACQIRWENSSHFNYNSQPHWVPEEDDILISLKSQGYDWPDVAERLPARTPDDCENRWYNLSPQKGDPSSKASYHPVSPRTSSGRVRRRPLLKSDHNVKGSGSVANRTGGLTSSQRHGRTARKTPFRGHLRELKAKPKSETEAETMPCEQYRQVGLINPEPSNLVVNGRENWKARPHTWGEPAW